MSVHSRWRFSFSTAVAIFIVFSLFGGFIALFYFLFKITSLDEVTIMITAGLVGIPLLLGAVWYFKTTRERRFTQNIALVQHLRRKELLSEKDQVINETIKPSIEKIGAINIQTTYEFPPKIAFNFSPENKLDFLAKVSIALKSSEIIILEAVLQNEYPFSLSIRKTDVKDFKNADFSALYYVFSTHSSLVKTVSNNKSIQSILMKQAVQIKSLTFNGKFVSGVLSSPYEIYQMFELIRLIYQEISIDDYGDVDIEALYCYSCGDIFETHEEKCDNCGVARPTCTVCLLDLKLSEKEEVVSTPCCEVYAHRDHILAWLEKNPKCPNCKKDLFLWIRTLKEYS
jgi:hypothetical protein